MPPAVWNRLMLLSSRKIAIALLLGALIGLLYSVAQAPSYRASARVIVVADADTDQKMSGELATTFLSQRRVQNYRSLLTSPALLQRAITFHGLPTTAEDLERNLTVTSPRDTALIDVTVTAESAQRAADYATSIAQEFVAAASQLENQGAIHVRIVHTADVPAQAYRPRTTQNMVNAALAVALLVGGLELYRGYRNPTLRQVGQVDNVRGVPVVGTVGVGQRSWTLWPRRQRRRRASRDDAHTAQVISRLGAQLDEPLTATEVLSPDRELAAAVGAMLATGPSPSVRRTSGRHSVGERSKLGVLSTETRWDEAVDFAESLRDTDGQALLVIADIYGRRR